MCVDSNWLRGMRIISRCAYALVDERTRAIEAVRVVNREIKPSDARLTLMRICFADWDGSPHALQTFETRNILHCVRTNARYYRIHGRF